LIECVCVGTYSRWRKEAVRLLQLYFIAGILANSLDE
jgi:hypothetical protein